MIFYFVRSGEFTLHNGKFWLAGQDGYWWSSRGSSARDGGDIIPSAYRLSFNITGTYPSGGPRERHYGFPLRCLSTVLDI